MNHIHFENKSVSRHFFWFLWLAYALVYMTKSCFSAAMASIVFEGAMTKSQTGFITAMFYLFYAPLQIVGGIYADRYDPERLIKIGLVGSGIANLIIFFNQNYYLVLTAWIFNAIVQFAVWPSIFKISSSQLIPGDRKNSAYYISFAPTAGLLLAYLVAAMLPKWQYNFAVSSAVLLLLALVLHIVTKRIGPYMVSDEEEEIVIVSDDHEEKAISAGRLFSESGFYILLAATFIITIVSNTLKTYSATMLMETYEAVSPSLGNLLNMFIIGIGIAAMVLVKGVLYPTHIKSAPIGLVITTAAALLFSVVLIFIGKVGLAVAVVSMCLVAGSLTGGTLFLTYCNLRFAKFGKSGTAAGLLNAATTFGMVVNSYGAVKIAEVFDWQTVALLFFALLVVAIVLGLIAIPLWKRFKKKYHASSPHPLAR